MARLGVVVVLSMMIGLANTYLAAAVDGLEPIDKGSNGKPVPGIVDTDTVVRLRAAEELFNEDGKELEALEQAASCISTFEANRDYENLLDCVFFLGEGYYYLGDWAQAEKYMERAWYLGSRYYPEDMNSYPLKIIGESQFELDKFTESMDTFFERVQWLRKAEDKTELAGALFDYGGMQINSGRLKEAVSTLKEAMSANNELAEELNKPGSKDTAAEKNANKVDNAEITYHLAIAYYKLNNFRDARLHLEQAHAFFKSIDEGGFYDVRDRLVAVLDDLVLVCEKLSDKSQAEAYRRERDRLNQ